MIYLASPYSDPLPQIRQWRFLKVQQFVWVHLQMGRTIISPIVYGHQFAEIYGAAYAAGAWADFNFGLLSRCDELWILRLPGWEQSGGIALEIEWAKLAGLPITEKEPLQNAPL
jgi:hypothetical protein